MMKINNKGNHVFSLEATKKNVHVRGGAESTTNPFGSLGSANINNAFSKTEATIRAITSLRDELPKTSAAYTVLDVLIREMEGSLREAKETIYKLVVNKK